MSLIGVLTRPRKDSLASFLTTFLDFILAGKRNDKAEIGPQKVSDDVSCASRLVTLANEKNSPLSHD